MKLRSINSLHQRDFYGWCMQQSLALSEKNLDVLDFELLAEELKNMGDNEEENLENRLIILFEHILKCMHQPHFRTGSWDGSIREQRKRIAKRLKKSPSLAPLLPEICADAYEIAVIHASEETRLSERIFPKEMPFTFEEAMEKEF